jgi:hypothetical protein
LAVSSRLPLGLVVLPLLTLLALAFSMLSDLSASRLVYARVWGGPPSGALAVRVQLIEEESGLARGVSAAPVTVEVRALGSTVVRSARTDAGGFADVRLPLGSDSTELELLVHRNLPGDPPLARGPLRDVRALWLAGATRAHGGVPAEVERPLIAYRFEPPVWSVPFAADLIVELHPTAPGPVHLDVQASGARVLSARQLELLPGVPVRVHILPLEHGSTVSIGARSAHGRPERTLSLPVRPGSLTMVPGPDVLTIVSPVPREHAYYAVVNERGRLGGGSVSLGPRPDGTSAGRLARGDLPPGADRYLVLSSSPDGQAPALVGLPLDGQWSTFDAWDVLLLDGRPAAARAAQKQRQRVRFALGAYAALGGALSLALFVWHIRRANERLRADLAEVGAPAEARDRSLFGPLSALLCLLFAFGLALTWILLR